METTEIKKQAVAPWTVSDWAKRRLRLDLMTLILTGVLIAIVVYVMYTDSENSILANLAIADLGALVTLLGVYVGFATQDDKNAKNANLQLTKLGIQDLANGLPNPTTEPPYAQEDNGGNRRPPRRRAKVTPAPPPEEDPSSQPPPGYAE